jgi:hypothetical protein
MKTQLTFNTRKLIENLNSTTEFYQIKESKNSLDIMKKYKNKRGRSFSISLPKKIQIFPDVVGLIVGEGFFGNRTFVFANSNKKAISRILDFLEQFNLSIKIYLEISTKNKPQSFINKCKKFWEDSLKTKIEKIRIRKEFNNITEYGTIHLILNNSLLAKLLARAINISKRKVENNRQLSISYLKGILAAEGNINVKSTTTNCLYMVRVSASKQKERDHYKRCLEKAGLNIYCKDMPTISKEEAKQKRWKTTKGRAGAVIISRWENFVKILNLGLLDLSKDKKSKFLEHFECNKFTKQFLDFQYFLNKEFKMKDAQICFGLKGRQPDRVLTLCKQGYISRKKINKRDYIYKLTNKYTHLYNKFKEEGLVPSF